MNRRSVLIALTLTLSGCASTSVDHADAWMNYTCSDGQSVQASYPDNNTAIIKLKGETHTLHVALSGSGARYIGEGWQWWTKGMRDGRLAPLAAGETIAGAPGIACHAE
jgi:membrane-bound inhibitor of C-type lysozyme